MNRVGQVRKDPTLKVVPIYIVGARNGARVRSLKVALVVPKCGVPLVAPPMSLTYIAAYLRKTLPNVEIKIFDCAVGDDPEKGILELQPDVVGITANTLQASAAYFLGDTIKRRWPNILTVIGGVHPTVMPREALDHFDIVVVGDGEKTFSQIVQKLQQGQPQRGILEGLPAENLDEIPSPAFDLIKVKHYLGVRPADFPNLKPPTMGLITSRGCPYQCAFCWNSHRKTKVRYHSAERIVEEILFYRKEYDINSVFFGDDEFLINSKRIRELSVLFKKHGISKWLKWGCNTRATTVTIPLLRTIKDMGCVILMVGLESGTNRMLQYLKAGSATLAANEKALMMADQVGIMMGGNFILGTPTETFEEMRQTINWAMTHTKLKLMFFNMLTPYPGTSVWDLCKKKQLLPEKVDYERLSPALYSPEKMYFIATIQKRAFVKLIKDVYDILFFINQVRPNPSVKVFAFMLKFPAFWKALIFDPRIIFRELLNVVKNSLIPSVTR